MKEDEFYMKRCLELAKKALGKTYPNPLVGSVIVHDGKIIGEGTNIDKFGEHQLAQITSGHLMKSSALSGPQNCLWAFRLASGIFPRVNSRILGDRALA